MTEYTITGARYSHPNHQGVLLQTTEHGLVLAAPDMPQSNAWLDLQEWLGKGGTILPWEAVVVETPKSEFQELREVLIRKGLLTESDLPVRALNGR